MDAAAISRLHESCHLIAFAIGKGGAGKTSCTANIAAFLAENGWPTLVVCLDPQDNLGEDLGYTQAGLSDGGQALAAALLHAAPLSVPLKDVRPNLDVVPSGPAAGESLVMEMVQADRPSDALATALAPLAGEYRFILIDCPPFSRYLQRQAFVATQYLVVPSQADAASRKGVGELASEFVAAREINPDLTFLGVCLFDVPAAAVTLRDRVRAELDAELATFSQVLQTTIRSAKAPAEAARREGVTMAELARNYVPSWKVLAGKAKSTGVPKSTAGVASDYEALTVELLQLIGFGEEQA